MTFSIYECLDTASLTVPPAFGRQVMTGSYHNYFRIYDTDGKDDVILQADKSAFKTAKKIGTGGKGTPQKPNGLATKPALPSDAVDFSKKILHGSWHPKESTVAVSCLSCFNP
jgi:serine/threonine-protein phosphatase 2A regulatory subunit B